ncbi:MAG: tol-pal system protein YbgF [Piscirickettsiaceae bacterium]|nr:MAG: tol-pal system protein YbgF [Piscirickettsiaceae bacterium]PCI70628.1 MAG: tol-pal system protein YbgF [Piscirickettsiaceae bacterium]
MKKIFKGQIAVLLLISGAASAALPPVVNGNGQVLSGQQSASGTVEMYNRLQQLQQEVQQLIGQVEEQAYVIETLKKRQRDLYLDTDRRIQLLEGKSTGGFSAASGGADVDNSGVPSESLSATSQAAVGDNLAYEKAFSSLKSGRYKQAIVELADFSTKYPNSSLLPNALYWLGEASYVNRDFKRANTEFNKVVKQFPDHSKAKDALLKIGFIQYENKQWKVAKSTLNSVSKKYHGTTAARLADQRLERMHQEKR